MKAVLAACLLAICLAGKAQAPDQATAHAPDGGTIMRIQSIAIFPLTGAPFSATVNTESTRILADGSTATEKNRRIVARDSSGRIFQQRVLFSPQGDTDPVRIRALQYQDPIRHELYDCIVAEKTCYATKYLKPAMAEMPAGIGGLQVCGCATAHRPGLTITQEALGQKTIEDVEATGSREITTLPAGQIGNNKPEPIVKEFWYSPRLGINLVTMRFDPLSGSENFVVNHVSLDEPDPKLFEPPSTYQIIRQMVERPATAQAAR
jgi:hypothetical protein